MSGSVTSLKDFNLDNANLGDQINGWEIRWQDFEYDIDRRVPAWSKEHVLALIKNIILRIPDAHGDFVKEICGAANKWDPETDVEFNVIENEQDYRMQITIFRATLKVVPRCNVEARGDWGVPKSKYADKQ